MTSVLLDLDTTGAGLAVLIKDTLDVALVPTRAGSAALAHAAPAAVDAEAVRSLRAAGCRIAGKTKLHELAFGATGINTIEQIRDVGSHSIFYIWLFAVRRGKESDPAGLTYFGRRYHHLRNESRAIAPSS